MTPCPISVGYYASRARRSARNALLRNGVFALVLLANVVFNLVLDAARSEGLAVAWVLNVALLSLLAWRIAVAVGRLREVTKHPLFADFARYGDPRALVAEVEGDCESGAATTLGDVVVTRRFLLDTRWLGTVVRLDNVAWVHARSVRHSVNFIPVGTTHTLELHTWGPPFRFVACSFSADPALMELLRTRCPGARFGYSPGLEEDWRRYCLGPPRPPTP